MELKDQAESPSPHGLDGGRNPSHGVERAFVETGAEVVNVKVRRIHRMELKEWGSKKSPLLTALLQ